MNKNIQAYLQYLESYNKKYPHTIEDKTMREPGIPFMSYVFVGITSVVLALVTVLDKGGAQEDNKSPESSTSLLPNIFATSPTKQEPAAEPAKTGGKRRKTSSNKSKLSNLSNLSKRSKSAKKN